MNRQNTIYYRFKSEKRKYTLNFEQTEISIGDIKKLIIRRRNMEKYPEKFELIIMDERTNDRFPDEVKIEPLRTLLIERVPFYKLNPSFREFICDSTDIPNFNTNTFLEQKKIDSQLPNQFLNQKQYDPLEKILLKINLDTIKAQFSCKFCGKLEGEPMLTVCCGQTACELCIKRKVINEKIYCPFGCETELNYLNNQREKELRERLVYMLNNFKLIEKNKNIKNYSSNNIFNNPEVNKVNTSIHNTNPIMNNNQNITTNIVNQSALVNNNSILNNNIINQARAITSNSVVNISTNLPTNDNINNSYISPLNDMTISQTNPHFRLFENSRFFIIKSSNRENVITSQTHNEWATTVANQKKLNDAFYQKDVILIFSVNKSGFFQGYAVMTSFITNNESKLWNNDYSVKLGGTFSTQWLVNCDLPFSSVKELNNPLNNGEPVIKSRDTQELPKEIGIQLCHKCYEVQESGRRNSYDTEKINKIMEENKKLRESKHNLLYRDVL